MRIFVTNKLPEHTSIHWHGQRLPNGMDGVTGLTQPAIQPGKTFVYEFVARRPGTFMYHPHADEMTQMAMGMMGFWVTHPKGAHPLIDEVDRDFVFLLNAYDIEPGSAHAEDHDDAGLQPVDLEQPHLPGHRFAQRAPGRQGAHPHRQPDDDQPPDAPARPRVPGHRHRRRARRPRAARWHEVTTDVAVGQMRQIEFVADEEGDWAFHCHKSHHTMNAMGHDVPTMIGVDHRDVVRKITKLIPDYMVMGERGMADMAEMEMPLPDNTAPMMGGEGPVRLGRDGRHVQRRQGAQGPEARRLQRPRLVQAPRGARSPTNGPARAGAGATPRPKAPASPCRRRTCRPRTSKSRSASRPWAHSGTMMHLRSVDNPTERNPHEHPITATPHDDHDADR